MDQMLERIIALIGPKRGASKELADYLGIHPNVITNWKNGRNKSYIRYLPEISEYFNVTTDYLLTGDDKIKNTVRNVSNSAVVQGPSGDVSISNIVGLQDNEAELLRVFRSLDIRGQTAVLMAAYEEEEKKDNKK